MNMTHDSQSALDRDIISVCEACGDFIEYWGFKSIHGKIWSYLAISSSPLSQQEVASALSMSKGSISIAMSELTHYGLVRQSGSQRHAPYEAVMDVWPVISQVLREREWMLLESARVALEGLLVHTERIERSGQPHELHLERIRSILQMTEWSQNILKMVLNARLPKSERWGDWIIKAAQWGRSIRSSFDVKAD